MTATESGPAAAPTAYAWEATDEQVAARYGVPVASIVRFDLNTSPAPPEVAARIFASGEFGRPVSEYPPSDYRPLVEAAAERYGVGREEVLVGAGADEVLDLIAKTFLPPGGTAVVPIPTYSMYRALTEQRPATACVVPRRPAGEGYRLDLEATRIAARRAHVVWLCSPNNPTGLPEPDGTVADLLDGLAADAGADRRDAPLVALDEAYAEFLGTSLVGLRAAYPRLVTMRTASKAYALAGMRVGFALARPELVARMEPYRPPGSLTIPSVAIVAAALAEPAAMEANVARLASERERLTAELGPMGLAPEPSVTNFLLIDCGTRERARAIATGLLRRGLVPRTFPADHPLADHLRLTVRSGAENDRLISALRTIAPTVPR